MLRRILIAFCLLGVTTASYADLVGHWRMGEGATWDGVQWTIPDQQPEPADGTSVNLLEADLVDGLALLGETAPHQAMNFPDGPYVSIGNPAKLDITGSLTVCAWVKPNSLSGFGPIVGKGDHQYMLRHNGTAFQFFTYDGGWHQVDANVGAVVSEWYFVAGRVDSSTSTVSIWVNNAGYGTATGGIITSTYPVEIGRNSEETARVFDGVIDDVRIYNHALTDAELLNLYYSPVILQQPVVLPATTVYEGEAVTMTVVASGTAPTYKWYKDGEALPGQTAATLSIPSAVPADSGNYYVEVTNEAGTATSETVSLLVHVKSAPIFTQDPKSCTRYVGGYLTFTFTVQGTPPITFKWKKDGNYIDGQTGPTLSLTDIKTTDAGKYVCEASNALGITPSAEAVLTVIVPPPGSFAERVISHKPVAFWRLNESEGTTAFDYVGGYDGTHSDGVLIASPGPQPTQFPGLEESNLSANYDASYEAGTEMPASLMSNRSAFTMLGWINMPAIVNARIALFGQNDVAEFGFHNADLAIWTPDGGYAAFDPIANVVPGEWMMIAAIGDGATLSLYLNGDLLNSVADATTNYGESSYPFRIGFGVLDATGNYLTGGIDEVALFDHALTQNDLNALYAVAKGVVAPKLTIQPTPVEGYEGTDIQMTVSATGTLPFDYQWYKGDTALTDGAKYSGTKTAQLWINDIATADEANYKVVVSNPAGPVPSDLASLTVVTPRAGSYEELMVSLDPVAYWSLNEASGTVAFDRMAGYNAAHDIYVYPGQTGPQPPYQPGMEADNLCTLYEGATDYETTTAASLMNNRAAFTIAGWINPNTMPQITKVGASSRVALFGQNDVAEFGFHGTNILGIWSPTGGYVSVNVSNVIVPNEWTFIVATGDGTSMRIYRNGQVIASGLGDTANYGSSGSPFRIGYGVLDSSGNWFDGFIDEVGMWDRALTQSEVLTLYNKGMDAKEPPTIVVQPASGTRFEGSDVTLSVVEAGSLPMTYQWRKGEVNLTDGGNVSGTKSANLVIADATAANAGEYDVVVSNPYGPVTSGKAVLNVVAPPGSFAEAVVALGPVGYWPFDDDAGATIASDVWNGHHGAYAAAAVAGEPGVSLAGFAPDNKALRTMANTADSQVNLPSLGFNTNTVTILCWIKPDGAQGGYRGLVFLRSGGPVCGLHFGGGMELRYSWADSNRTWGWDSGLVVPDGQWTMAAVVVEPTKGTIYMGTGGVLESRVNPNAFNHPNQNFRNSPTRVGWDSADVNRHFNGWIDEVAIWNRALSPDEIAALYQVGATAPELEVYLDGANVMIKWSAGTLESASEPDGSYNKVEGATSPWPIPVASLKKMEFFRATMP